MDCERECSDIYSGSLEDSNVAIKFRSIKRHQLSASHSSGGMLAVKESGSLFGSSGPFSLHRYYRGVPPEFFQRIQLFFDNLVFDAYVRPELRSPGSTVVHS